MVIIPNYNETSHNDCNQCNATEYWFLLYMSMSLILNIWLFKMIKSITFFVMQIRVIFCSPLFGALGSCPSRLPLDPPLSAWFIVIWWFAEEALASGTEWSSGFIWLSVSIPQLLTLIGVDSVADDPRLCGLSSPWKTRTESVHHLLVVPVKIDSPYSAFFLQQPVLLNSDYHVCHGVPVPALNSSPALKSP